MRIITLLLIAGFCLALLFGCGGEEKKKAGVATVVGRVTEPDSATYLAGALVYETREGGDSVYTDSMGYYRLESVPFDSQLIVIEMEGYMPDTLLFHYPGELEKPLVSANAYMRRAE